jgi:O-antigen/teichoic acid export membrane protein
MVAMVLVGVTRPAFNFIVNRTFGPEINGRAGAVIALIFLASLLATASIPTVMVRHVSRALGADQATEAAGQVRLAIRWTLILAAAGTALAVVHALLIARSRFDGRDIVFVAEGVITYSIWRLYRTLLVAIGEMKRSIIADVASAMMLAILLSIFVLTDTPKLAVQAFIGMYAAYALMTTHVVLSFARGGSVGEEGRKSFARYSVLWFIGTASSLAARELALLILDTREAKAAVGELSVALSLLTMLAFAPRIIEVPLVHELSMLGGRDDRGEQVKLTNTAMEWLMLITLAGGFGTAIPARPILAVANVQTPEIALAFVIISFAFCMEMVMTPATNLLISESDPRVFTWIGAGSLVAALLFWYSPFCTGTLGIAIGLAISFAVKGIAIGWYAQSRHGVTVLPAPFRTGAALLSGFATVILVHRGLLNAWIALIMFEALLIGLFFTTLRSMLEALLRRP